MSRRSSRISGICTESSFGRGRTSEAGLKLDALRTVSTIVCASFSFSTSSWSSAILESIQSLRSAALFSCSSLVAMVAAKLSTI